MRSKSWTPCLVILLLLMGASVSRGVTLIAYSLGTHELVFFDSGSPQRITRRVRVSGLPNRESLAAIDIRPATGELYGFGTDQRLYRIDLATGQAQALSAPALTLDFPQPILIGMDFDPVTDQVRLTGGYNINLRMNPDTGALIATEQQFELAPGQPGTGAGAIINIAYTNNFAGATTTTLYGINRTNLMRIGSPDGNPLSPNSGQVFMVGSLGIDTTFSFIVHGFDIAPEENTAFILTHGGTSPGLQALYSVNLTTGAARFLGEIGRNEFLWALTVARVSNSVPMVALTKTNKLLRFHSATPGRIDQTLHIDGLPPGETLVAIDLRPKTGQLYALSDAARLYRIETPNGASSADAVAVSTAASFVPDSAGGYALDFNPATDRLRVLVGRTGDNLQLNPDTGAVVAVNSPPRYAPGDLNEAHAPRVSSAAHTTELANPLAATLYAIDSVRDTLVTIGSAKGTPLSPDTGQLSTVGLIGFDTGDTTSFDVSPSGNSAFAVFNLANAPRPSLYSVDLQTGAATAIAPFGTSEEICGLAVETRSLLRFASSGYTAGEMAGSVRITVTRAGDASGAASVEYESADATATQRADYHAARGTLRFAHGETTKTFDVFITNDALAEGAETFTLRLDRAVGAAILDAASTVTIADDDSQTSAFNPIDDIEFFVRQHYRDFLYREAEPEGLEAWVNVLRRCPNVHNNPRCDRVTVSSSFFRSLEFQDKGYFIYRYHKVGLLGKPPRYEEFLRDVRRLDGQTAEEIAAQKNAFALEWVKRFEFQRLYSGKESPELFVQLLEIRAGESFLTSPERESLIADLQAGRKTQADAVRYFVEHPLVISREFNEAFVTMQYFGYLKRDPEPEGFENWMRVINRGDGYRVMVHGFVNSVEYRARFGRP
ncbi:MAG TPA: DUF4394 domain-containing protein [Pyrinomonadaceae bacterium]|nr:DUF4394 domain-containing protein [Pyrinomonadaceae bacterium]